MAISPRKRERPEAWENYVKELGINLQRARHAKGISQERVAQIAGVAAVTYQQWEQGISREGRTMNPRLDTLLAVSQALGLTLGALLPKDPPDLTIGR